MALLLLGWLAVFVFGTASPAAAHAEFVSSDPAPNSALDASPQRIVLRFNQSVALLDRGFRLLDQTAAERPLGRATAAGPEIAVPLAQSLPDGAYVLVYRVVSADSHPVAGSIPFTVGAVAANAPPALDVGTGVDGTVRALWWVDRWVGWAGLVLLVGVPAFVLVCWPAGARDRTVRRLVGAGYAAVVATAVAGLPLQAANATGAPLGDAFSDGSVPDLLSRTAGEASLARIVLAVLIAGLLAMASRGRRAGLAAAGVATIPLLLTYSWAGHPAVGRFPALTLADDALHLAAASFWLGGLVVLGVRLLPRPVPELTDVLTRWSRAAMAAVAVLVATGSIQAWRELQSVSAITGTAYGRWVLAKVAGLVALVALGNLGRLRIRRWAAESTITERGNPGEAVHSPPTGLHMTCAIRRLRRSVAAELVVGLAVLAATAVLVVTTPGSGHSSAAGREHAAGGHGHGPSVVSVELPNRVKAEVGVEPATVGTPLVTVSVRGLDGAVLDPLEVTVYAALPSAGIEGIALQLTRVEAGRYVSNTTRFPFPGEWRITVTVRTTDVDSGVGTVSVHLE